MVLQQALHVKVELTERRRSMSTPPAGRGSTLTERLTFDAGPSPFGDVLHFASQTKLFYSLFDDASCADICFIFPRRKGKGARTIYAQKSILRSVDYFRSSAL